MRDRSCNSILSLGGNRPHGLNNREPDRLVTPVMGDQVRRSIVTANQQLATGSG
jgi:hypothetical protein